MASHPKIPHGHSPPNLGARRTPIKIEEKSARGTPIRPLTPQIVWPYRGSPCTVKIIIYFEDPDHVCLYVVKFCKIFSVLVLLWRRWLVLSRTPSIRSAGAWWCSRALAPSECTADPWTAPERTRLRSLDTIYFCRFKYYSYARGMVLGSHLIQYLRLFQLFYFSDFGPRKINWYKISFSLFKNIKQKWSLMWGKFFVYHYLIKMYCIFG